MGNGPSTRRVVRISLAVAGTVGALYLLYLIRSIALPIYTCNPGDFAGVDDLDVVPLPIPPTA